MVHATTLPASAEDALAAVENHLSLLSGATDRLTTAGYTLTHPAVRRRGQLTGAREALRAAREIEHHVAGLLDSLHMLVRRLDPLSEMLPEARA